MTKIFVLILLACFLLSDVHSAARSSNEVNSDHDGDSFNLHLVTLFQQLNHQISHAHSIMFGTHGKHFSFEYCNCLRDLLRAKKGLLADARINMWDWFLITFYKADPLRLNDMFLNVFLHAYSCHLASLGSIVHIGLDFIRGIFGRKPKPVIKNCPCPCPKTSQKRGWVKKSGTSNKKCWCPCPKATVADSNFLHRKCMRELNFVRANSNSMIDILKHEKGVLEVIGAVIQAQDAYLAAHKAKSEKRKREAEKAYAKAVRNIYDNVNITESKDKSTCDMKHVCDHPKVRNLFSSEVLDKKIRIRTYYIGKESPPQFFEASIVINKINEVFANMGLQFDIASSVNHTKYDMSKVYLSKDSNEKVEFGKLIPAYKLANQLNIPRPGQNEFVVIVAPLFWTSNNGFAYFPGEKHHGYIVLDDNMLVMTEAEVSGILIHEIGHALGLYHTFRHTFPCGRCFEKTASDFTGDFCKDTPPDNPFLFGNFDSNHHVCHTRNDKGPFVIPQCNSDKPIAIANTIPLGNYMSSREPGCRFEFTKCQYARMSCYAHWLWNRPKFDNLVQVDD